MCRNPRRRRSSRVRISGGVETDSRCGERRQVSPCRTLGCVLKKNYVRKLDKVNRSRKGKDVIFSLFLGTV